LVSNIRKTRNPIVVSGIGSICIDEEGDTKRFGKVAFSDKVPCNILSFYAVAKLYKISWLQNLQQFIVHVAPGLEMVFSATDNLHLYAHHIIQDNADCKFNHIHNALTTVADNQSKFTVREVKLAQQARELQRRMAFPSNKDLHHMISTGGIVNSPVTNTDIRHADEIWGPSIAQLKGKSKAKAAPVYRDIVVDKSIVQSQSLYSDLFFVDNEPFLISVAVPLDFVKVTHLKGKTAAILWIAFNSQVNALKAEGFEVKDLFIDQEGAITKIRENSKKLVSVFILMLLK
jgi:hypothetical protein